MKIFRLVCIFLVSCVAGFAVTHFVRTPIAIKSAPIASAEEMARAFRAIKPVARETLADFFSHPKGQGILYIYRSDCTSCVSQWIELASIERSLPLLAISADDSPQAFAISLASTPKIMAFTPYYMPPSRILGLRTELRAKSCGFTGALPFVAITDGKGQCLTSWQGLTARSAIEAVLQYKAAPKISAVQ